MYYKENQPDNEKICEGEYSVKARMYVHGKGYLIYWHSCYAISGNQAIQITKQHILRFIKESYPTNDKELIQLCNAIAKMVKKEGKFFVQNWEYKVLYPSTYGYPQSLHIKSFRKL